MVDLESVKSIQPYLKHLKVAIAGVDFLILNGNHSSLHLIQVEAKNPLTRIKSLITLLAKNITSVSVA